MKQTKTMIVTLFCIGFALGSVSLTYGQGSPGSGRLNYDQLALLRWYPASQDATFPVGGQPAGMAFDGANIWV